MGNGMIVHPCLNTNVYSLILIQDKNKPDQSMSKVNNLRPKTRKTDDSTISKLVQQVDWWAEATLPTTMSTTGPRSEGRAQCM